MISHNSSPINSNSITDYKKICNAFGCIKNATHKIDISVGTFGVISLDVCNNCVKKFVPIKDEGDNST